MAIASEPISARIARLGERRLLIVHSAVAASLAWLVATEIAGHARPFFAPLAAIIVATGARRERHTRRTVELVVGVAMGIGIGDLLARAVGTGTWQILVVVSLAMAIAVLLDSGRLLMTQAAVSAALVVTLQPPGSGFEAERFVDALIGGVLALVAAIALPAHPIRAVDRAAQEVLDDLAAVLSRLSLALRTGDLDAATAALHTARSIEEAEQRWRDAVEAGHETTRTAPAHRHNRVLLEEYALAAEQIDLAQRNVRVLARAAVRAIASGEELPEEVRAALDELAAAFASFGRELGDDDGGGTARDHALRAAAVASSALGEGASLRTNVIVSQVRSAAVDLLRAIGENGPAARAAVREAADEV